MQPPEDKTPQVDSQVPPESGVPSRRRLLHGAITAVPVLLTLASRPVLGNTACATPSAAGSPGSNARTQQVCQGMSASYWSSNPSAWPTPYVAGTSSSSRLRTTAVGGSVTPATLFHSSTTGFAGTLFGGKPLSEVLQMPNTGTQGAGKYCAAALLNARSGRTPPLTETIVRNLWNGLITRGYYEPTAGVKWYADDIVRYIRTTIG